MHISAEKIWNTAQEHLRVKLSRDTFNMWFAPLRPCIVDGQELTMEAPNEFCEVWLKDNYLSLLQDAVAVAAGCRLQVKFKVPNASPPANLSPAEAPAATQAPRRFSQESKWPTRCSIETTTTETCCSIPRTRSTPLLLAPTIISRLPPPKPWPKPQASPTIHSFSTGAWDWAKPTCCMPSAST